MHGRPTGLFITASPLAGLLLPLPAFELPLPLQLLMASEQLLSRGMGLQEQGQGFTLAQWEAILKGPSEPLE